MLVRLHKLAQKLQFFRPFSITLGLCSLLLSVYCLLVDSNFTAQALQPAIVVTLWGLMSFSFLQLFQTIPPPVLPHDGFFRKLSTRMMLALYSCLAAVVVTITIFLLWLSVRLLSL